MKILIWAASILLTSIIAVMIKSAGITLDAIPTMILYAPLFFITPKLCKKWDEHKANKEIQNRNKPDCFPNNAIPQSIKPKTSPKQAISNNYPQAVTVTQMHRLSDYFGKFVKLEIDGLENWNTFHLRHPDLSRSVSEEAARSILEKALTELRYSSIRGDTRVKIEPISVITAKSYEDNHYIYGILRRRPKEDYVLTNAFIVSSNSHLQIIAQALKSQGMFEYTILDDGTISIFDFTSDSVENLEIPEAIDGKVVSAISRNAFSGNQEIKTLIIPNSVKSFDYGSFCGCNNLERVFLGDGVVSLNGAFDVCQGLKKVHIGKCLSEVNGSFHNCHEISAFDVDPDSEHLCAIDGVLFSKDKTVLVLCPCGKKGKYIIPNGTKVIGESAFENTELEEIVISNTVEKIEFDAFAWAGSMKKLTIPSSVVDIEYEAISVGIGEIVVEQSSYAQQYFKDFYEGDYNLVVIDKPQINATTASTPIDKNDKLFCRRCGMQLPLDSDFCFKCGTKVEKEVV